MHPVLFRIGGLTLHSYGVLLVAGVLLGLWIARRRAAATGLDPERVWNLGVYMVLAGLVGAKLWYVLSDWGYFSQNPGQLFSLEMLQAGGVFYGGFLGALITAVAYASWAKLSFLPLADAYMPGLALGHALGRLGCFFAGCCWGKETEVAWGVTFTDPAAAQIVGTPLGIRLHPTQLYESAAEFAIFGILWWLTGRQKFTGQIFAAFVILYGAVRFTNEFFRGDPGRTMLFDGAMSLMQVVSIGLVLLGVILWLRGARTPAAAPARSKRKA